MRVKTNKETLRRGRLVGPLSDRVIRILKSIVFAASLSPVAFLLWDVLTDQLNANPFNAIVRSSGFWSLRFLCLTLAITPLRWLTGWHSVVKFRRMFGLFGFFYATVHTAAYVLFDRLAGLDAWVRARPLIATVHTLSAGFYGSNSPSCRMTSSSASAHFCNLDGSRCNSRVGTSHKKTLIERRYSCDRCPTCNSQPRTFPVLHWKR